MKYLAFLIAFSSTMIQSVYDVNSSSKKNFLSLHKYNFWLN